MLLIAESLGTVHTHTHTSNIRSKISKTYFLKSKKRRPNIIDVGVGFDRPDE